jgi:hypothetical protein
MLEIQNLAYPEGRRKGRTGQYVEVFRRLQPGQCIKVGTDPKEVSCVAAALRNYLETRGKGDLVVTQISRCEDGIGRVWLLPKDMKPIHMADVPGRRISKLGMES